MPDGLLTLEQFGQKLKAKYPQYKDMPDSELAAKMLAKYPEYKDMVITDVKKKEQVTASPTKDGSSGSEGTPNSPLATNQPLSWEKAIASPIGTPPKKPLQPIPAEQPTEAPFIPQQPLSEIDKSLDTPNVGEIQPTEKVIPTKPIVTPKRNSPEDFGKALTAITPELLSVAEETVVPELNNQFNDFEFKFEEKGSGNAMKVTAPNGKTMDIRLTKDEVVQSKQLQDFIRANKKEDLFSKSLANQDAYNKRFLNEKEIVATNQLLHMEQRSYQKGLEELTLMPFGEEYDARKAQLETKHKELEQDEIKLQQNIGKYIAMKAEQGTTSGYLWNQLLGGFTGAASGLYGLAVDYSEPSGLYAYALASSRHGPNMSDKEKDAIKKQIKKQDLPIIRKSLDFAKDQTVTKEYEQNVGFVKGAIGGLVGSVPAMLAAEGMPLVMFAQIADGLDQEMDKNPDFENVSENEKLLIKSLIGIPGAMLEYYGFRNAVASKGLLNDLVLSAIGKSTKNTTARSFKEMVEQDIKNRIAKGALIMTAGGLAEAETGASQEFVDIGVKEVYNAIKKKEMFETPDSFYEGVKQVAYAGAQEAIGGLILGAPSAISTAYKSKDYSKLSDTELEVTRETINDPTIGQAVETSLQIKVNQGELTPDEAKEQLDNWRSTGGLINSLPDGLTTEQVKRALPVLQKIQKLRAKIEGKEKSAVVAEKLELEVEENNLTNITSHAIQKSKAEGVLPRQQGETGKTGSEREGVGQQQQGEETAKASPKEEVNKLIGKSVLFQGKQGEILQDEGGKLTFETDDTVIELIGNETASEITAKEQAAIPEPEQAKITTQGDNLTIGDESFTILNANKNKKGTVVSFTLRDSKGRKITKRNEDLVLDIQIAQESEKLSKSEIKPEEATPIVDIPFIEEHTKEAVDIIENMPDEIVEAILDPELPKEEAKQWVEKELEENDHEGVLAILNKIKEQLDEKPKTERPIETDVVKPTTKATDVTADVKPVNKKTDTETKTEQTESVEKVSVGVGGDVIENKINKASLIENDAERKKALDEIYNSDEYKKYIADAEHGLKNNPTQVADGKGKGTWRKEFNETKDAMRKKDILRAVADVSTDKTELNDISEAAKGLPGGLRPEINQAVDHKLQSLKETPKAETPKETQKEAEVLPEIEMSGERIVDGVKIISYKIKGWGDDSVFSVEPNKDGYIIHMAIVPMGLQRQGIGTDFYIKINKESIEKTGYPLRSSERLSDSAGKPFWERLVRLGYAEKTTEGKFQFIYNKPTEEKRKQRSKEIAEKKALKEKAEKELEEIKKREVGTQNYKEGKNQLVGRKRTKTIANGEEITGRYKVVSADDVLASHNEETFSQTVGFPVREDGTTPNDRDYKQDKNAQSEVIKIAGELNDKAIDQTPVVSKDGIVLDGNNRTMSRKLAAKNGTDAKYLAALKENAEAYGIDPNEIDTVKNPMLVFETDTDMPYTTETFKKFNVTEKKEKSPIDRAIEVSKTITDPVRESLFLIFGNAENMSDVTSTPSKVKEIMKLFLDNKILVSAEMPRYFDVSRLVATKEGVEFLKSLMLGSALSEKAIRTLGLEGNGDIKNKLLAALVPLIKNRAMGDNSLQNEVERAIEMNQEARNYGQTLEAYAIQEDLLVEKNVTASELAVAMALGKEESFKQFINSYNEEAGKFDLFAGKQTDKSDIIGRYLDKKLKGSPKVIANLIRNEAEKQGDVPESGVEKPIQEADKLIGETPKDKIVFERNTEKIKAELDAIDDLLGDLGKPDFTVGGLSKIDKLSEIVGRLVKVGYYKIEDIAKYLAEKGMNEWIPYLKEAFKHFKANNILSTEVLTSISNDTEINRFDPSSTGYNGQVPEKGAAQNIQGGQTPIGASGGTGGRRPPIRIADEANLPTPKKEHVVAGKYDIDETQRFGANVAIDRFDNGHKAFLLADGAGVGKTREQLVMGAEMQKKTGKKTLIVTESQAIIDDSFAKDAKALGIDISDTDKWEIGTYYDLTAGKIGKGDYGVAIYDEAHNLKNPMAARSIQQSKVESKHNVFATATPYDKIEHSIFFFSQLTGRTPKEIQKEVGVDIEYHKGKDGEMYAVAKTSTGPKDYYEKTDALRGEVVKGGGILRREYPFYGEMEAKQVQMSDKAKKQVNEIDLIHSNRLDNADNIAIGRIVNSMLSPKREGGEFGAFKADLGNKLAFNGLFDKIKKDYEAGTGQYYSMAKEAVDKFKYEERKAQLANLDKINEQDKVQTMYDAVKKDLAEGKKSIVVAQFSGKHVIKAGTKDSKYGFYEKGIAAEETLLHQLAKRLVGEGISVARIYGGIKENEKFQQGKADVVLMTTKSGGTGINLDDVVGDKPRVMHIATSEYSGNKTEQLYGRVSRRNTQSSAKINSYFFEGNMADANRKKRSDEKQETIRSIVAGRELSEVDRQKIKESAEGLAEAKQEREVKPEKPKGVQLESISEKAFVVRGDTFAIKDKIKELGGTWNNNQKAWMFPEFKRAKVEEALKEQINNIANEPKGTNIVNEPTKKGKLISEIKSKPLTRTIGTGMGNNEMAGTFISTEAVNRYADMAKDVKSVTVDIENPYQLKNADELITLQNEALQGAKEKFAKDNPEINDYPEFAEAKSLDDAGLEVAYANGFGKYLAEEVTANLKDKGYDSAYLSGDVDEGMLVVFDKSKVTLGESVKGLTPDQQIAQGKKQLKDLITGKGGKLYDITTIPAEVIAAMSKIAIGYARKGVQAFIAEMRRVSGKYLNRVTDKDLEDLFNKANNIEEEAASKPVSPEPIVEKVTDTFASLVNKDIKSDEIRETLNNIERETKRELTSEEKEYQRTVRLDAIQHGFDVVEAAKVEFGSDYVSKLLAYLDENVQAKDIDTRSLILISLELDLERQIAQNPSNKLTLEKQLKLVRDISTKQQRAAAIATGYGILRQMARVGYDITEVTEEMFTSSEATQRKKTVKSVESDINSINKEAEEFEINNVPDEVKEKANRIREGNRKKVAKKYDLIFESAKRDAIAEKVAKGLEQGNSIESTISELVEKGEMKAKNKQAAIDFFNEIESQNTPKTPEQRLQDRKERIKKSIDDINEQIENKKRELIARKEDVADDELKSLQVEKKARLAVLNEIDPDIDKSEKAIVTRLTNEIEKIDKQINDGKRAESEGKKNPLSTTQIESLKAEKKARLAVLNEIDPIKSKLVKDALIEAGFGREITVTTKTGKEKRTILDWKKLAGEEGSIENIEANVTNYLKDKGYSDGEIARMSDALQKEYNSLRQSIIEKSANELNKGNQKKLTADQKTAAQRLAEMYNYGLFEQNPDSYDYLINKLLGISDVSQGTFFKLKELARGLSELYSAKIGESRIDPFNLKHGINEIKNKIRITLNEELKNQKGAGKLRVAKFVQAYWEVSNRMMLNTVKQRIENPLSGLTQASISTLQAMLAKGLGSPELRKHRRKMMTTIMKDIYQNGATFFGETNSAFITKGELDDYINKQSDSKLYHTIMSELIGRGHLEAMDAMYKSLLTDMYFVQNLTRILTHPSNPNGAMTKRDAISYISETLTGQNFTDAQVLAKETIDKINGKTQIVPDNQQSIDRLANDIVRQALLQHGKVTTKQLKAAYESAYTSAGYDMGHEANNPISAFLTAGNSRIETNLKQATKNKEWGSAVWYTIMQIGTRNILNPFVGGGTNWTVLKAQKAGIDFISALYNIAQPKKIDLSDEANSRTLENNLTNRLKSRAVNARMLFGGIASMLTYIAFKATGADDDYDEWLQKNPWAKKYANLGIAEWVIVATALENDELAYYLASTFNKVPAYDDAANLIKGLDEIDKGKGGAKVGKAIGSQFNTPLPWRMSRDIESIYRGISGSEQRSKTPKAEDFIDGWFKSGMVEYINAEEGTNKKETTSSSPDKEFIKQLNPALYELKYGDNPHRERLKQLKKERKEKLDAIKKRAYGN